MMSRYIFLDVDGTLVTRQGVLPDSAKKAIHQAKQNGHKVFLCTGRAKGQIPQMLWKLQFDGIICSAGAYIEADGEIIRDIPMPKESVKVLMTYLESQHIDYVYETIKGITGGQKMCSFLQNCLNEMKKNNPELPDDFVGILNIEDAWDEKEPVYKLLYFAEEVLSEQVMQELKSKYTVVKNTLSFAGEASSGEISALNMNKALGIECIMNYYGRSIEATVAFGDGANDYEMLAAAKIGVAMGNSEQSLKDMADIVTAPVDEDGLYRGFVSAGLI